MINFMLVSSGSPQNMWGEALLIVNHGTPQETWSYSILVVAHNVAFLPLPQKWGCLAKVPVPLLKKTKLGSKPMECIFIP